MSRPYIGLLGYFAGVVTGSRIGASLRAVLAGDVWVTTKQFGIGSHGVHCDLRHR